MLDEYPACADRLPAAAHCLSLPHYFIVTKEAGMGRYPYCAACKLPIDGVDLLVKRGWLHYNRNGWMQAPKWNVAHRRRIH
jgi:hypothetical protein